MSEELTDDELVDVTLINDEPMSGDPLGARPLYEDEKDLANEQALKPFVEKELNAVLEKLLWKYSGDFLARRGIKPVGYVEMKKLNNEKKKWANYTLSLHKAVNCLLYSGFMKMPFYVVVQWLDCRGIVTVTPQHLNRVRMMTTKRDDVKDIEPCILIPHTHFKIIP